MIDKSVTYSWQEDPEAVVDDNGLIAITVLTAKGPYEISVPNNDADKASIVAQIWASQGKA